MPHNVIWREAYMVVGVGRRDAHEGSLRRAIQMGHYTSSPEQIRAALRTCTEPPTPTQQQQDRGGCWSEEIRGVGTRLRAAAARLRADDRFRRSFEDYYGYAPAEVRGQLELPFDWSGTDPACGPTDTSTRPTKETV